MQPSVKLPWYVRIPSFFSCQSVTMFVAVIAQVAFMKLLDYWDMGDLGILSLVVLIGIWLGGAFRLMAWHASLWSRGHTWLLLAAILGQLASTPFLMIAASRWMAEDDRSLQEAFAENVVRFQEMKAELPQEGSHILPGRCVVVSEAGLELHYMRQLARSRRATSVGEVETVVQLQRTKQALPAPEGAWIESFVIRAMDVSTRRLLVDHKIDGVWREVVYKNRGKTWTGHVNTYEVVSYLRNLPRTR